MPTEPALPRPNRLRSTLAATLLLLLCSCSSPPPPPEEAPSSDACLQDVDLERLNRAIRRCNEVVAAHPHDPQPRNERALLFSLAGRNREACQDSLAAAQLLARQPRQTSADPLLVEEIRLRRDSCRQVTSPPAAAAPFAETSDAAKR